MTPYYQQGGITIYNADCRDILPTLDADSIDAVVTDPPYGLDFMGRDWDHGVPGVEFWREALRVAKPGAHLLAFGGTRTFHRLAVAIEDAGWEIRDTIGWLYGSGFPKSLDVSKAIDKAAGAEREQYWKRYTPNTMVGAYDQRPWLDEARRNGGRLVDVAAPATDAARQWAGFGTALKPSWEPIIVARKPLEGTVAANVLKYGTGAINVDGCRIGTEDRPSGGTASRGPSVALNPSGFGAIGASTRSVTPLNGRFPANLIHDGSEEVLALFPQTSSGGYPAHRNEAKFKSCYGEFKGQENFPQAFGSNDGSAARFFYTAKASASERGECDHPTVKPLSLMRYLCRLVTPPGGLVLDPFAGSGTTGRAAVLEGFRSILVEQDEHNCQVAAARFPQGVLL